MLAALIRKELLALSRDPHGLAALFLMPLAFIVIMSLALQNQYAPTQRTQAYVVFDRDGTNLSHQFTQQWAATHGGQAAPTADWQHALKLGRLRYVLFMEDGFAETLESPSTPEGVKVRLLAEPGLEHPIYLQTQAEVAASVGELRANSLQERFMGLAPKGANAISRLVAAERLSAGPRPTSVQQNVPAWLIFGMFFVVTAIASLFVQEQRDGTLLRLHSLGVPTRLLLLGKALPYLGVNAVQAVLMLSVGVWLMPLIGGEGLSLAGVDWPALLVILASVSLASVSFALVLASLSRTHAQASALGAMCNIFMAAIGGIMVPTFVMPALMQRVAAFSPMNWGLEGLLTAILRHGDFADVLPAAFKLCIFAAVMAVAAAILFTRRIR